MYPPFKGIGPPAGVGLGDITALPTPGVGFDEVDSTESAVSASPDATPEISPPGSRLQGRPSAHCRGPVELRRNAFVTPLDAPGGVARWAFFADELSIGVRGVERNRAIPLVTSKPPLLWTASRVN